MMDADRKKWTNDTFLVKYYIYKITKKRLLVHFLKLH